MKNKDKCPLCQRDIAHPANLHHLLPISKGGKHTPTVLLHVICHNKIHSLFTEKELAKDYNSIEKLLANEEIQKFIKFVSKQPPTYYDKNKRANRRK
jgi:hypothetical protein